jgi:predicted nucleic acid-binding protein
VSESQQELEHLDLGESEAISLALRVSADLVLRTSGEAVRSLVTAAWGCHARWVSE